MLRFAITAAIAFAFSIAPPLLAASKAAPSNHDPDEENFNTTGGETSLLATVSKESISASGGTSEYSGAANSLGAVFRAQLKTQASRRDPWSIGLSAHAHEHRVSVEDTGGPSIADKERYLRLKLGMVVYRQINRSVGLGAGNRLDVGAGVGFLRVPLLRVKDDATARSALDDTMSAGPLIAGRYRYRYEPTQEIAVAADLLPFTFGQPRALAFETIAAWRAYPWRRVFAEIDCGLRFERLSQPLTCPAVPGCQSQSRTNSSMIFLGLGAGSSF